MNLKKIGKAFTSKFVGTGHSSYEKRIYRAAVSQRLTNTGLEDNIAQPSFIREVSGFRRGGNLPVPSSRVSEDGTDIVSRNVVHKLPIQAA